MEIQLWTLLGGVLLPYFWAGAATRFKKEQLGSVDLGAPRVQSEQLEGIGARAWGAQMNAWEALGVFLAANLAALMVGVDPNGAWAYACMVWLIGRVAHGVLYIGGQATMRVAAFLVGTTSSVSIFVMAFIA